jgi:phosphate transport system permease protein
MSSRRVIRRHLEEQFFKVLMIISFSLILLSLGYILLVVLLKGLPSLNWAMVTQTPTGNHNPGQAGGILNAILGSIYLAGGATLLAILAGLPLALFIKVYGARSRWVRLVRLALDVLWGIPSIVYGAFGFIIMLALGLRASLLSGMITLALLEFPIMVRAMDEVVRLVPEELEQASFALGLTRLEYALQVVIRQVLPGLITGVLLGFGRGIGDAASMLFTAGYTDRLPTSLLRPVASLPLAIFFQLNTPYPAVQKMAYASALILTIIILAVSLGSRWISSKLSKYVIRS